MIATFKEKFWTNPQFSFNITDKDLASEDKCWIIIALMQKYTRQKRAALHVESAEEYIQFRLYKVSLIFFVLYLSYFFPTLKF